MTAPTAPEPQPAFFLVAPPGKGIAADVFAAVSRAIGALWPDARMGPGLGGREGFAVILDPHDQTARVSKKTLAALKDGEENLEDGGSVIGWDGQSLRGQSPAEAAEALAHWAHVLLSGLDAVNYVEQSATTSEGRTVVVTARWAEGLTPHQARQKAEQRLSDLAAAAERVTQWADHAPGCAAGQAPRRTGTGCTCGLDALRQAAAS